MGGPRCDRRRKRFRLLRQRDRAQSLGSVASLPYAAHTAPVSVGPTQSYASTPPQPKDFQSSKTKYYKKTDVRGSGQRQGKSSSQFWCEAAVDVRAVEGDDYGDGFGGGGETESEEDEGDGWSERSTDGSERREERRGSKERGATRE
ncbi:hypothetical protein Scep_011847 [Stephania cephalantha]|uniref:Uncharacterized protein n=1 Tax=Stephania cephalantha TaxID=152367 RepID=A0AAP0JE58_9MAGN